MRALQISVIVMGVLIVAGLVVVFVELGRRTMGGADDKTIAATIELPAGAALVGTDVEDGRLYVTVALPGGGHSVLIHDAETGARLGVLELSE